ncbi:MAG: DsbA family protein [Acidobacteriota bacterium]
MFRINVTNALMVFLTALSMTFSACAQSSDAQSTLDREALKAKIVQYIHSLNPRLEGLELRSLEKDAATPFLKGTVAVKNRGREQKYSVFVTDDGGYLILGQVWNLDIDPIKARWLEKKKGAQERQAKIDFTDRPTKGNLDAAVTVVEYSDYQCPFCSRAFQTIESQLLSRYKDRIRFVYKHLPLVKMHPWARKAAIASACAYVQNQEAFWGMHSQLFEGQKEITKENLRTKVESFAGELKLDVPAFLGCYDDERTKSVVETDMNEAGQLGVTSTPTFLINGAIVAGAVPFEEMASYIDFALDEAGAAGEAGSTH